MSHHVTTQLLFVLFLLLVALIVMNLLVGLAISNITEQFVSAGINRLRLTVILVQMLDQAVGPFYKHSIFDRLIQLQKVFYNLELMLCNRVESDLPAL